jgi:hypothetical protein
LGDDPKGYHHQGMDQHDLRGNGLILFNQVNKMGGIKKAMFDVGMTVKRANVPVLTGIVDNVIFSAVKDQTGGKLRYMMPR